MGLVRPALHHPCCSACEYNYDQFGARRNAKQQNATWRKGPTIIEPRLSGGFAASRNRELRVEPQRPHGPMGPSAHRPNATGMVMVVVQMMVVKIKPMDVS